MMKEISYEFRICLENESQLPYVNYKGVFHTCRTAASFFDKDACEHRELLLKLENLKLRREKEELEKLIQQESIKSRGVRRLDGSSERETERINGTLLGTAATTKRQLELSPFNNQSIQNALISSSRNPEHSDSERRKGFYTAKTNTSMTNLLNKLESKIAGSLDKKQSGSKRMSKTAVRDITVRRIRLEEDVGAGSGAKNLSPQANLPRDSPSAKNGSMKLKTKGPAQNASQLKKILGRVKTSPKLRKEEVTANGKIPYYEL